VLLRVGLLVAVLAVVVGVGTVWSRIWAPDPLAVRREFGVSTWHMALSHPWLGTGLGTWSTVYPAYAIVDVGAFANQAHDDWLQWTAEGGFPFGIMLATLFFWSLRPAFRSIWGLGVVGVFLHAIVDYPFARPGLGSWPIVILSMLAFAVAEGGKGGLRPRMNTNEHE
jgi:O-antigen ligase